MPYPSLHNLFRRSSGRCLPAVALAAACAWSGSALAVPMAVISAPAVVKFPLNVKLVGGPGGTAARAQVGGRANNTGTIEADPEDGDPFSDQTLLDGESAIGNPMTKQVGLEFQNAYSGIVDGPVFAARDLEYNVDTDLEKKAGDTLSSTAGPVTRKGTTARASSTQSVAAKAVTGTVSASIVNKTQRAFAAALTNDPVILELDDPGEPAAIEIAVGQYFTMTAEDPRQSALAIFDVATDRSSEGPVLTLTIGIDGLTSSIDEVSIDVLAFNPALFAGAESIADDVRALLTFDAATHTLNAIADIVLYDVALAAGEGPVTVTYNYGGLLSQSVPAPAPLALVVLGLAAAVAGRGARRRGATGAPRATRR